MAKITGSKKRRNLSVVIVLITLVYALIAAMLDPLTWPITFVVAIPCIALVALAIFKGWHQFRTPLEPPKRSTLRLSGFIVWFVLIAVVTIVQMLNYYEWPRTIYPTLSSLAGQVYHIPPIRAASFWLWLWLGWYFVDR